jgi:hypothetical protein
MWCHNPENHISTLQYIVPIGMDSHFLNIVKCNHHFCTIICVTVIQIILTKEIINRFYVIPNFIMVSLLSLPNMYICGVM